MTSAIIAYKPLPDSAEQRTYHVAGLLLRTIDRAGLRPAPDRLYVIDSIDVYRRRIAVYSIRISRDDACAVINKAVDAIGLHMAVVPHNNGHVDLVCDLYARDFVEFYSRV